MVSAVFSLRENAGGLPGQSARFQGEGEMMDAMKEAAEILKPENVTHYDSPHYKRVISELVRIIVTDGSDHAMELRDLKEELNG